MTGSGTWVVRAGIALAIGAGATLLLPETLGIAQRPHGVPPQAPASVRAAEPTNPATAPLATGPFVVRRILDIPRPFVHGDHVWDERGAPPGPIVITVDLQAEVLSVFRGGYEIGAAVILYGADHKPTPTGIYPITEKDADHVSNLYGAPMPYMLRLTNDGISVHGSDVLEGGATHGCIGVPVKFARKLFDAVRIGDRVIVTNGEVLALGDPIFQPASSIPVSGRE